ncbi:GspH/FimT family pseudopilin [Halioxenophilus sp. WMMB6]|uniref:GspH/FimT family pseudopilin n=1 Tax=Halioxenophilus sp. WMMB6 TaxID=3073815 RepID=UPI00295EE878|nr:GspH/FimT family pseudopilin [Halioxenophilus sp. WMMB6]
MSSWRINEQRGFTLIELLIVISIMSILLTVGVPNMVALTKNSRLSAGANDLVNTLSFARAEAVRRGANVVVTTVNGAGGNEWGEGASVAVAGTDLLIMPPVHDTITADGGGGIISITFTSDGSTLLASSETIEVCDNRSGETGRQITILVSGIIDHRTMTCS